MGDLHPDPPKRAAWRDTWSEIIFGHETFAGRLFDIILLTSILLSVLAVLLESVRSDQGELRSLSSNCGVGLHRSLYGRDTLPG